MDRPRGIVVRNLQTGAITRHSADAVVLTTGGYGNVFNLSTYARGSHDGHLARLQKGACLAIHASRQIHPTCIPVSGDYQSKLTLMSSPCATTDGSGFRSARRTAARIPPRFPRMRDYYLERMYGAFGNLAPRDVASRAAKYQCDEGRGIRPTGLRSILISPTRSAASAGPHP